MSMHRSRSGRTTSLRESESRLSESEKVEGAGSWDALEWTKVDPVSRSVPQGLQQFLLESEQLIVEGYGVVLVNTDEAGTLFVTNFRLLFLSEGSRSIIGLGTIPLATIEKFGKTVMKLPSGPRPFDKTPSQRLLQVIGKDMRIIVFGFRPRTKQRRAVYDALLRTIEDGSFTLSNEWWRISKVNSNYTMCATYPFAVLIPNSISDVEIQQACTFRARCRLPVISWCHPGTGAVLARSSQPLVGLMMNMRSNADEKLVAALWTQLSGIKERRRKLYIADARPRKNALANGAMVVDQSHLPIILSLRLSYLNCFQIVFFGIDNIHAMRESLVRLREYVDTHGANSSDGMSSFLRHGGWTWGGGNLSSMSASVSTLGDSGWLIHVQSVLAGSAWIAARVALESATVLVHCSDGWDRTTQLVSLASLLLDPYYRTIKGFQALIEKDWLAFAHPFSDRLGVPTVSGSDNPFELSRQASTGSIQSSPGRQSSGSFTPQPTSSHAQNNYSPIFLQWVDCVSQLLRMYPFAFEFSSVFLVDLLDCVLSCRFGNFFCNSEKERQQAGVYDSCGCLWMYLADLRVSDGRSHVHYNHFYDPSKTEGPLLPPAAALAPTLWPQFHLRWACPLEVQAGDIETHCRNMGKKISELQKAKELADAKVMETTAAMESLTAELRNEKLSSVSARDWARRAKKESAAIKRAVQSLGCKVHFLEDGDCIVSIESNPTEIPQKSLFSVSEMQSGGYSEHDEKSDNSASVAHAVDDDSTDPISRVCESLCPFRTRDGGCRWPNAGCAQFESQFVGLKANYDAFDRLSIYDSYF
ncbi:UNVERIFIED_CONTAM: Phosphatidylinositol-3-phosphatase myotubularin-1 [Sesamum latifolium]|uniref:phosphatidylinositol-3,5-bisphosphate 3-phosphatase n=1 Tax=Sesamum latifolium TaxID=2727402 RepID=A0AAW2XE79_9LAMI